MDQRSELTWVLGLANTGLGVLAGADAGHVARADAQKDWANSSTYVCRDELGRRVVIKQGRGWRAETARRVHDEGNAMVQRLMSLSESTRVPRSLAWHADPAAVCSEFVDGEDGAPLLARLFKCPNPSDLPNLRKLIGQWGGALADFHLATQQDLVEEDRAEAQRHDRRVSRVLRLPWARVARVPRGELICRSFDDVGFHNVRIGADGLWYLLDLPTERTIRYVHYDVAAALAWLDDAYRDAPWSVRGDLRRALTDALIEGYSSRDGCNLQTPGDRWWIRFHQVWSQLHWVRVAAKRRHRFQLLENGLRALSGAIQLRRYAGRL